MIHDLMYHKGIVRGRARQGSLACWQVSIGLYHTLGLQLVLTLEVGGRGGKIESLVKR